MSRVFIFAFIAGVLLAVLAVSVYPLPKNVRYRSLINVEPNSGRQEDFVIRWPQDRIVLPREERRPPPAGSAVGAAVLEDSAGQRASAELFRLRNTDGDVIGVASRVAAAGGLVASRGRSVTNWMLLIPSRGALFLTQVDAADVTARSVQSAAGTAIVPPADVASFWSGGPHYRVTAGAGGTGSVLRGTDEFEDLAGTYSETWELEEVGANGSTRGRILLSTVTVRSE